MSTNPEGIASDTWLVKALVGKHSNFIISCSSGGGFEADFSRSLGEVFVPSPLSIVLFVGKVHPKPNIVYCGINADNVNLCCKASIRFQECNQFVFSLYLDSVAAANVDITFGEQSKFIFSRLYWSIK